MYVCMGEGKGGLLMKVVRLVGLLRTVHNPVVRDSRGGFEDEDEDEDE